MGGGRHVSQRTVGRLQNGSCKKLFEEYWAAGGQEWRAAHRPGARHSTLVTVGSAALTTLPGNLFWGSLRPPRRTLLLQTTLQQHTEVFWRL